MAKKIASTCNHTWNTKRCQLKNAPGVSNHSLRYKAFEYKPRKITTAKVNHNIYSTFYIYSAAKLICNCKSAVEY